MWPHLREKKPVVVAIGVFDGVHLGHRAVLAQVKRLARRLGAASAVVAFARHPLAVLDPHRAPPLLTDPEEKARRLRAAGLRYTFVVPFTRSLARVKAGEFLGSHLVQRLHASWLVVGAQFSFGHNREGTVSYLKRAGPRLGCRVQVVHPVRRAGHRISSTLIRTLIVRGRVKEAARWLGRPHRVRGVVRAGSQVGRRMGYPTANVASIQELLPGRGVYLVKAQVGEVGPRRWGLANIGIRPTLNGRRPATPRLEVHVMGARGRWYGRRMAVEFVERLRGERRFPSMEALRRQIRRDEQRARLLIDQGPRIRKEG